MSRTNCGASFQDVSAGELDVGSEAWLLRVQGKTAEPEEIANFLVSPRSAPQTKIPLDRIAVVRRAQEDANQLVSMEGASRDLDVGDQSRFHQHA